MNPSLCDDDKRRALIRDTFNAVAPGYDNDALRFFPASAAVLAASLYLRGDEKVLDVATGTGNAALEIASRIPRGRVVGTDIAPAMLEQARSKAAALELRNVEFLERDMEDGGIPDGAFDAVVCAFGVFFVEDMAGLLGRMAATVRPGGQVAVSTFRQDYFGRLRDLLMQRLAAYGVPMPPETWKSVADEGGCTALFEQAGLRSVRVLHKNMGYHLPDAAAWWDVVWNAGFRRLVGQLKPRERDRFRQEHLQEVEALATPDGIWLDVGVLFTIGRRP